MALPGSDTGDGSTTSPNPLDNATTVTLPLASPLDNPTTRIFSYSQPDDWKQGLTQSQIDNLTTDFQANNIWRPDTKLWISQAIRTGIVSIPDVINAFKHGNPDRLLSLLQTAAPTQTTTPPTPNAPTTLPKSPFGEDFCNTAPPFREEAK